MDCAVFDQHSVDERDRIFLFVSRRNARDRGWNYFADRVGGRDLRTIFPSPRGTLALDLCGNGDDRALLQYLRVDRATFPEGARPESFGTNTDRATIVTQLVVLALFVLLTIIAAIRFRGEQVRAA